MLIRNAIVNCKFFPSVCVMQTAVFLLSYSNILPSFIKISDGQTKYWNRYLIFKIIKLDIDLKFGIDNLRFKNLCFFLSPLYPHTPIIYLDILFYFRYTLLHDSNATKTCGLALVAFVMMCVRLARIFVSLKRETPWVYRRVSCGGLYLIVRPNITNIHFSIAWRTKNGIIVM